MQSNTNILVAISVQDLLVLSINMFHFPYLHDLQMFVQLVRHSNGIRDLSKPRTSQGGFLAIPKTVPPTKKRDLMGLGCSDLGLGRTATTRVSELTVKPYAYLCPCPSLFLSDTRKIEIFCIQNIE